MAKTVTTKKKTRRLKRSIRKTLGSLLLISSLIVAAIPVDGLQAKTPAPENNWGTLKDNFTAEELGSNTIPVITANDMIYTTGNGTYQFAYRADGQGAVILGYVGGAVPDTLVIPDVIECAYLQRSITEGTNGDYVAVGTNGNFLYYRVEHTKDMIGADGNPVLGADNKPVQEHDYWEFKPCLNRTEAEWIDIEPSQLFINKSNPKGVPTGDNTDKDQANVDYEQVSNSGDFRIRDIQVWYIGNQYLVENTSANQNSKWVVGDRVTYANKEKGVFAEKGANITGLKVGQYMRGIGDYAFYGCTNLSGIELNNGLSVIGVGAFAGCRNMEKAEVALTASISIVGDYAFYGCASMKTFTVPTNVRILGDSVFEGCTALTHVELTGNGSEVALAKIGNRLFRNCTSLESMTFPASPDFTGMAYKPGTIDLNIFENCINLQYVEYAGALDRIALENIGPFKSMVPPTFYFKGLKDSQIHKAATANDIAYSFRDPATGLYVFELTVKDENGRRAVCWVDENGKLIYCKMDPGMTTVSLPSIIGPHPVESIGEGTFQNNCFLQMITIPESIKSIEANAFRGAHNLRDVIFENPKDMTAIGAGAFKTQNVSAAHGTTCPAEGYVSGGNGGGGVWIPDPKPELHFVGPVSTESEPFKYAMDWEENINAGGQPLTYITYYSGWPTNLAVQYIPENPDAPSTGKNTLIDYPTLQDMLDQKYSDPDKYAYITPAYSQAAAVAAEKYLSGQPLTEDETNIVAAALNMVLPDGIEAIGPMVDENGDIVMDPDTGKPVGLFEGKENKEVSTKPDLRKTITAEGIITVEENAFKGCKYLEEITFSDKTVAVDSHAFEDCKVLKKANLPATLVTMGYSPFLGCDELTDVNFNGNTKFTCKNSIIYELNGEGTPEKIVEYLNGKRPRIVEAGDVEGIKEFYPEAFMGANVTSVDLTGASVANIPENAFRYTPDLYSVTLPESCRSISKDAFSDSGIQLLRIPNASTVIHQDAFNDTDDDGKTDRSDLTFQCVEGSTAEIYAKEYKIHYTYILPVYTVNFYDEELKIVYTDYVEQGGVVTPPEDLEELPPVKGYTRLTWTPPAGTIVTADTNVYAKYEQMSPSEFQKTVNFFAIDKETVLSTQTVTPGEEAVPPVPPDVEGYAFTGWWPEDMKVTDETENPYNIYAQYEKIDSSDGKHTVRFFGYDGNVLLTLRVEDGKDAAVPASLTQAVETARQGYTFTGWKPLPLNITADMDTYAQYVPTSSLSPSPSPGPNDPNNPDGTGSSNSATTPHTLTVRNGSGSGSYRKGEQVIVVANNAPSGQEFGGWTVSPASTVVTDKTLSAIVVNMPDHDVALIANYKAKSGSSTSTGTGNTSGNRPGSGTGNQNGGGTTVVIDKNGLSNTGVVSATVNGSSDNFTIKITESSEAAEAILRALLAEYGTVDNIKYFPMDISLYDSTGTKKITDTTGLSIDITLPLPDSLIEYAGNNKIAGVVNDKLDPLTARFTTINSVPCITFRAEHFSPYVIYVNTGNMSADGTVDDTPQTGDSIHPKWFLSIGLACLSLVMFVQKDSRRDGKKQKVKVRVR